ncbi:MAG: putative chemotaxis protein CheW [Myxococcaceae bacterium]|nr:putative chemotaxis protein CheW [Myxococcaceae bacterium]
MSIEEREREILAARARALSLPRDRGGRELGEKYALFERSGVRYAIAPRYVFAIAHVLAPTPLPGAAPHWCGVTSSRGELLAVFDLALLLSGGERQVPGADAAALEHDTSQRLVMVLGVERRELGVVIDSVLDSRALALESSELARAPAGDSSAQLVLGTMRDGTRVVRGDVLLADPRLFIQANHSAEIVS